MDKKFKIQIIRPSGIYYQNSVLELVFPAHDGLRAILYNHAPFICLAGNGIVRLQKNDETYDYFYMRNGVLSVQDNQVSILTESILSPKDIDRKKIEEELELKQNTPPSVVYPAEQRSQDIQHLKYQLELLDLSQQVLSAA